MQQQRTTPRRRLSRWLLVSIVLASVGILGMLSGAPWGNRQPQAKTLNFRKASVRPHIAPAQPSTEVAPQSEILQISAATALDPHREAVQKYLELLEQGYQRLKDVGQYTATFLKQERLGNELTEGDVAEIKIRHSPFSVYMNWVEGEPGKELLFVSGANDDKMIVKQVGWKAAVDARGQSRP